MYCYTFSQCINQDLAWIVFMLSLIAPVLVRLIWRKEIKRYLTNDKR